MIETGLTLQEKLEELMVARDENTLAGTQYKEAFDAWLMEIGEARDHDRQLTKERVTELEAEVKELALAEYEVTKNKHLCPGVEIKINRLAGYSPDEALEWARIHQMALIPESLDEKDYAKLVLDGRAPGTITEAPQAQIARDLARALKGD